MKCFVVLLLLSVLSILSVSVHAQERPEAMKHLIEECMNRENLSDSDKQAFNNHYLDNASQNLKCFSKCLMEKQGQQNDPIAAMLIEHYGEQKLNEVRGKCFLVDVIDNCETANKIHKCLIDNNLYI